MGNGEWGLQHGVLHVLQVNLCFTVDPHAGAQLPHHGCTMGWRGINLCSSTWNTFSSSFFPLTLQGCCSHIFWDLSLAAVLQQIFPLNCVILEVLPPLLIVLPSNRSHLEYPGFGFVRRGGSFWELLPLYSLTTKTLLCKPNPQLIVISPETCTCSLWKHRCWPRPKMSQNTLQEITKLWPLIVLNLILFSHYFLKQLSPYMVRERLHHYFIWYLWQDKYEKNF